MEGADRTQPDAQTLLVPGTRAMSVSWARVPLGCGSGAEAIEWPYLGPGAGLVRGSDRAVYAYATEFKGTGRVGAMLKVRQPGLVRADDSITVVDRPGHGVRVRDLATGPDATQMRQLLDSGISFAPPSRPRHTASSNGQR